MVTKDEDKKPSATIHRAEIINIRSLGGGLDLVKVEKVVLNDELATWLLNQAEKFVADRPIRWTHVEHLAREMERGTFMPEQVKLITCELDGAVYRMNGQHTCWAVINLGKTIPVSFEVEIMRYKAKTEHDMRRLYATIDRGAPRTKANVVSSYLQGTEVFADFNTRQISLLSAGYGLLRWPIQQERMIHGGEDLAFVMVTEASDLTQRVGAMLTGYGWKTEAHMLRAPVIAAIYATMAKAPKIAGEFWHVVATGTGVALAENDPRYSLRQFLQTTAVTSSSASGQKGRRLTTAEEMLRVCLTAWNAHRENRPVQFFRPASYLERPKVKS